MTKADPTDEWFQRLGVMSMNYICTVTGTQHTIWRHSYYVYHGEDSLLKDMTKLTRFFQNVAKPTQAELELFELEMGIAFPPKRMYNGTIGVKMKGGCYDQVEA